MYADYEFYTQVYLLGRKPKITEDDFPFWEREARTEIDRLTFNRLKADSSLIPDEVKYCACALAELYFEADSVKESARSQGLAGPISSWSNDGQSGSVDLSQSQYTESGMVKEKSKIIHRYLYHTGLLYAGVCRR